MMGEHRPAGVGVLRPRNLAIVTRVEHAEAYLGLLHLLLFPGGIWMRGHESPAIFAHIFVVGQRAAMVRIYDLEQALALLLELFFRHDAIVVEIVFRDERLDVDRPVFVQFIERDAGDDVPPDAR